MKPEDVDLYLKSIILLIDVGHTTRRHKLCKCVGSLL